MASQNTGYELQIARFGQDERLWEGDHMCRAESNTHWDGEIQNRRQQYQYPPQQMFTIVTVLLTFPHYQAKTVNRCCILVTVEKRSYWQ